MATSVKAVLGSVAVCGVLLLAGCGGSEEAAPSGGAGTMVKGMDTERLEIAAAPEGVTATIDPNAIDPTALLLAPPDGGATPAPVQAQAQVPAQGGAFPAGSSGLTFADGPLTWAFDANGATATITGCTGCTGSVAIPGTVTANGYSATVTAIDAPASGSRGVFLNNGSVTAVSIPGTVTSVGDEEFQNTTGITSMSIPSSVTSIGYCSFCGMTSLTSMTIGSGLQSIGGHAFHWQTSYTGGYTIPASVTSIGGNVFNGTPLTSLTFAGNAPQADDAVLSATPALTSITVQGSATGWTNPWKGKPVTGLVTAPKAPDSPPAPVIAAYERGLVRVDVKASTTGGVPDSLTVTATPGGKTCTVTGQSGTCTVTGLAGSTGYTFTATATNVAGTSVASAPSVSVTTHQEASVTTTQGPNCNAPARAKVNWSGCDKSRADLSGENLSGANLSGANLSRANLAWANLSGANLSDAKLGYANLQSADLTGANLTRANLTRADLYASKMGGVNLTGANLNMVSSWHSGICPSGERGPYPCTP